MGFGNLLKTVRKLNRMGRWANEYMTEDVRPTISSHSFTVTQAAQMLGTIEEKNGVQINWRQLYEKAINHDVKEALTGDILSHVKNHTDEIKTLIEEAENVLTEKNIFSKLPEEYLSDYRRILNNGKDETIEGLILEAADKIDCLIECIIEIKRNNPEAIFFETYVRYVNKLKEMNMASVRYFLSNTLPELIDNHTNLKRITKELLR
ncbi:5'-deoxynucleotidase YfbR [compost metagenome]